MDLLNFNQLNDGGRSFVDYDVKGPWREYVHHDVCNITRVALFEFRKCIDLYNAPLVCCDQDRYFG